MVCRITSWFRRPYRIVSHKYVGVDCYIVLFKNGFVANSTMCIERLSEMLNIPVISYEDIDCKLENVCFADMVNIKGILRPVTSSYSPYTNEDIVCYVFGVEKKKLKKALDKIVVR